MSLSRFKWIQFNFFYPYAPNIFDLAVPNIKLLSKAFKKCFVKRTFHHKLLLILTLFNSDVLDLTSGEDKIDQCIPSENLEACIYECFFEMEFSSENEQSLS